VSRGRLRRKLGNVPLVINPRIVNCLDPSQSGRWTPIDKQTLVITTTTSHLCVCVHSCHSLQSSHRRQFDRNGAVDSRCNDLKRTESINERIGALVWQNESPSNSTGGSNSRHDEVTDAYISDVMPAMVAGSGPVSMLPPFSEPSCKNLVNQINRKTTSIKVNRCIHKRTNNSVRTGW
jgi:hypothetical protein